MSFQGALLAGMGLAGALATVSALLPDRSLQDRLAGTWLVPKSPLVSSERA